MCIIISEVCVAAAAQDRILIGGDLYVHQHDKGGVLDLDFATAALTERIRWSVDQTVMSNIKRSLSPSRVLDQGQ